MAVTHPRTFLLFCFSFWFLLLAGARAEASLCNPDNQQCWGYGKGSRSSTPAYPSASSGMKINPSAVPIEDSLGIETIMYDGLFDFALVKGNGRIGAGISPSNGEETFWGAPSFEVDPDYLKRKIARDKFTSQKVTLATAMSLWSNKKSGLSRASVNLGIMGKYNLKTDTAWPGAGVSAVLGPMTFGYAIAADEFLIDHQAEGLAEKEKFRYTTETYSVGISLNSLALDYSFLRIYSVERPTAQISLLTGSYLWKHGIFTVSYRAEDSDRPLFDWETQTLKTQRLKENIFLGAQFSATKFLMLGVFYDYYLLHELSLGATLFF
jgi:hypothetical protein